MVAGVLLLSACGDPPMNTVGGGGGGPDAMTVPDARTIPDAMVGGGFVSNTPGATVVDVGAPATPNAVLLSSNVLQEPSGGEVFQQWLAEFKNTGSTVVCQVSIDVTLRAASGAVVATFFTFADTDPYMSTGLPLTIGCIAPGKIGSFYDNGFVAAAADLSGVTRIEVRFSLHEYTDVVPAPHAPLVSAQPGMAFGEYIVRGTLTGAGGAIYNIGIDAYPRNASGLVLDHLFATDLDTLQPGAAFPFDTIGTPSPFTDYRLFVEFIDGPKPNVAAVPASPVASLETTRRAQRQAVRARAEQDRGHR
jgi:hypothetical protein